MKQDIKNPLKEIQEWADELEFELLTMKNGAPALLDQRINRAQFILKQIELVISENDAPSPIP